MSQDKRINIFNYRRKERLRKVILSEIGEDTLSPNQISILDFEIQNSDDLFDKGMTFNEAAEDIKSKILVQVSEITSGFSTPQSKTEWLEQEYTPVHQEESIINEIPSLNNPSDYLKIRERFFDEFKEMENRFENTKKRSIERTSMLEKSKIDEEKARVIQKELEEYERLKSYYNEFNKKVVKEDVRDALDKQIREKQIMIEKVLNEESKIRESLIEWDKLAKMSEDENKIRNRSNQRILFDKLENQIKEKNSGRYL
ncbi:unnamed protein product [Blepharisma stoltei]|uniref:Uncharacterized protein n=1 Tax=Blepharisma stoltei TaxID=1481888 RepID=A0AAU9JNY8_9CILI|nr:unnamed protein product [Blepharisma stoltei]